MVCKCSIVLFCACFFIISNVGCHQKTRGKRSPQNAWMYNQQGYTTDGSHLSNPQQINNKNSKSFEIIILEALSGNYQLSANRNDPSEPQLPITIQAGDKAELLSLLNDIKKSESELHTNDSQNNSELTPPTQLTIEPKYSQPSGRGQLDLIKWELPQPDKDPNSWGSLKHERGPPESWRPQHYDNGPPPPPPNKWGHSGPYYAPFNDWDPPHPPPHNGWDRERRGPPPHARGRPPPDRGPPPHNGVHPPHERGPPPYDRGPPPHDRGPPPHDIGPPPHDRGPPPYDRGPPPHDRGPPPHDRGPPQHGRGPPPHDRGPPPHERGDRDPPPYYRGPPPQDRGPPHDEFGPSPRDSESDQSVKQKHINEQLNILTKQPTQNEKPTDKTNLQDPVSNNNNAVYDRYQGRGVPLTIIDKGTAENIQPSRPQPYLFQVVPVTPES